MNIHVFWKLIWKLISVNDHFLIYFSFHLIYSNSLGISLSNLLHPLRRIVQSHQIPSPNIKPIQILHRILGIENVFINHKGSAFLISNFSFSNLSNWAKSTKHVIQFLCCDLVRQVPYKNYLIHFRSQLSYFIIASAFWHRFAWYWFIRVLYFYQIQSQSQLSIETSICQAKKSDKRSELLFLLGSKNTILDFNTPLNYKVSPWLPFTFQINNLTLLWIKFLQFFPIAKVNLPVLINCDIEIFYHFSSILDHLYLSFEIWHFVKNWLDHSVGLLKWNHRLYIVQRNNTRPLLTFIFDLTEVLFIYKGRPQKLFKFSILKLVFSLKGISPVSYTHLTLPTICSV